MRISALSLIFLLAAAAASAQTNAERMANDRYTRSHDFDLLHQRIELRNINWDSTSFDGRVVLRLVSQRPGLDSLILDAGHLLQIGMVRDQKGELKWSSHGDSLVVHLSRALMRGDTTRLTIDYHAIIDNGRGLTFIEADTGRPTRPRQLWSQGEADDNHRWFPTYDFPNDKLTWELAATVPKAYTVVSNGRLVSDLVGKDGNRTTTWSQETPSASYLVSIVVAPLTRLHDSWRGKPVDYYIYRGTDSVAARRLFRITPDMIETYSKLTGTPYPWAKYAQTTVADFFGGMENVSATTLVDWIPDANAYLDTPWYHHILIPHELAHQWFGDYVTTANWANMWLNEGFAEFMPGQYWQAKLGAHEGQQYYVDEYRSYTGIDRRRRMPLASLGSNNIYPKGALVLLMLQRHLGPERFWASVHRYLTDHKYDVATTDDFRQAILAATGENLDWFMDQWMYQAGYPEFKVEASFDSSAARLTLKVEQTQQDSSKADSTGFKFTTPAVFRMPVTIRVGTAHGDVLRHFWLDQRAQSLVLDSLAGPPTMVVFDDSNTIVKALEFQQPTAWLSTQLAHDPDLWNRQWVIKQLAMRKDDADAAAALATAATDADYYLTRAQAAEALGGFPPATAFHTLRQVMGDTSSAVRAAALKGLGALGSDSALGVAKMAFEYDESYNVRAAAVGALIKLPDADRRALYRKAVGIDSYRDAIAGAALDGIAQSGDTMMLDVVDRAVSWTDNAGFILAVLGKKSPRAYDLLVAHLNDSRQAVRHRALQAFEFVAPAPEATARLTAARDRLTSDKARAEVDATLARLAARPAGNDDE
ncbi:MAG: M1 family aminopeptidase [Gemmatimonadota bacterium]